MKHYFTLFTIIAFLFASCVKIPKEAVTLSEVVGQRITAIQIAHEAIVQNYFQNARDEIDRFMIEKWIPSFMEIMVEDTKILDLLNEPKTLNDNQQTKIKKELNERESFTEQQLVNITTAMNIGMGDSQRNTYLLDFSTSAVEQITLQRISMMNKIDENERFVLKEIRANYYELLQMQSLLTAHIRSAQKLVDSQDNILNSLGVLDVRDNILEEAMMASDSLSAILKEDNTAFRIAAEFLNSK